MTSHLPTRSNTQKSDAGYISDEDAVPAQDPTSTTELLTERLQAWKHMCGYLENYISEVAKDQKKQAKDQEKILKAVSHPLKEGHQFEQALGGVSGLFQNLRANTQAQSNLHAETSKNLTGSVLPILEKLHAETKNKSKELAHGAGKGSKAVDVARSTSQKHIELLGQRTGMMDSANHRVAAHDDPYVLQRQVHYHLNKQLMEENNNRNDLIAVQDSFKQFEAHVITTIQSALTAFNQYMSGQADRQKAMYGDVAATSGKIPLDFEWSGFVNRNGNLLISPNQPPRSMDNISFPNQNHRSTRPLIEGTLERKARGGLGALKGYSSGYYVITPAGYLHEYKDNDSYSKEPTPEVSLYLPDCMTGAVDGTKFAIKGKDVHGNKLSQKMSVSSEFNFKAYTAEDAQQWHSIIAGQCSGTTNSVPTSPSASRNITPINTHEGGFPSGPHSAASGAPYSATEPGSATMGPGSAVDTKHFMSQPGQNTMDENNYARR